jgi:signal peptidase II
VKAPLLFSIFMFILDQFTKFLINRFIPRDSYNNIISWFDFLNITNVSNTGIAFGMFKNNNLLLLFFIFLFLAIIVVWFCKNAAKVSKIQQYAFCLIISGGLGNLSDRLMRGAVIDFIDFGINFIRWPSFNIADFCIFIAVILLLIDMAFSRCFMF